MNTTKFKKYISVLTLAMCLGGASIALASPPVLSSDSREKVEKIFEEHRLLTDATSKELLVKKAELRGELSSPKPDTSKIQSLKTAIGTLEGKLLVDRVAMDQQLKKEGLPLFHGRHMQGGDFEGRCGNYDKGGMNGGRMHEGPMRHMHDE